MAAWYEAPPRLKAASGPSTPAKASWWVARPLRARDRDHASSPCKARNRSSVDETAAYVQAFAILFVTMVAFISAAGPRPT